MANLTGSFAVTKEDGSLYHKESMEFPNVSAEQVGRLSEYMDSCEKELKKITGGNGPLTITLSGDIDGVAGPGATATGITKKELVRFQRKMHNFQDKLLKYAEESL